MSTHIINVGYDSANYYIISPDSGRSILVDCGWPGTLGRLEAAMRRNGIVIKQVSYLLVTHFHPDHAGLTQELRNRGVELLLMEPQVPYVEDLRKIMKSDSGYVGIIVEGSPVLKPKDSRLFVKRAGISGEIIRTPGHSPDSVSLVLDEGIAFTGDLPPLIQLMETDDESRSSWKRIYGMGVKLVYPAHGNPYRSESPDP